MLVERLVSGVVEGAIVWWAAGASQRARLGLRLNLVGASVRGTQDRHASSSRNPFSPDCHRLPSGEQYSSFFSLLPSSRRRLVYYELLDVVALELVLGIFKFEASPFACCGIPSVLLYLLLEPLADLLDAASTAINTAYIFTTATIYDAIAVANHESIPLSTHLLLFPFHVPLSLRRSAACRAHLL